MGMNRIKTVRGGRLVKIVCYSQAMPYDPPKERKEKRKTTTKAMQKFNFRAAWEYLEFLLAENFGEDDQFLTLTYDDDHLPADRAGAQKEIKRYIRRIQAAIKKLGLGPLKYIYCTESVPEGPGEPRRLHHHMVANGGERAREVIRAKWRAGQAYAEPLLDGPADYEPRARYMVKERAPDVEGREPRLRAWTPSKNLKKPTVTSELVPDTLTITAPPGAFVLEMQEDHNSYGMFIYLKYIEPERDKRGRRAGKTK